DGWSTGIILKEFFSAYDTLTKGKTLKPKTKNQFKDFITWHRHRDINKEKKIEPQKRLQHTMKPGSRTP
ncbi:MAG: hypothetical protein GY757_26775, partial [bacterium]|nr:hypothetical protein [bacterium]